jgi:hypothetical protein
MLLHQMESFKRTSEKLKRCFSGVRCALDTVDLAWREGKMLGRLEGILKGSQAEAVIQHDHAPGTPHHGKLDVSICIVTAEPLSPEVRFRINRMFSADFPQSEIHFRSEFRRTDE